MAGAASSVTGNPLLMKTLLYGHDTRLEKRELPDLGYIAIESFRSNEVTYDLRDTVMPSHQIGQITITVEEGKQVRIIAPIVTRATNLSEAQIAQVPDQSVLEDSQKIKTALVDQAFLVSEVWSKCMPGPEGLIVEKVMIRDMTSWTQLGFQIKPLMEGHPIEPTHFCPLLLVLASS